MSPDLGSSQAAPTARPKGGAWVMRDRPGVLWLLAAVITALLASYEAVIAAHTGHVNCHETGAIEATGHKVCVETSPDGKVTPAMVEAVLARHDGTEHMVSPKMVYISDTTEIGTVYTKAELTAKADEGDLYLVELSYCGLIGIRNLPDEHAHAFLYAEAPRILFPFARRVIADATRDLGFQPMMIDPIDFNGLYLQQLQRRAEEEAAAGPAPAGQA